MQTNSLFPDWSHDPGGKIKTKLPPDIPGDAYFHGEHQEYRIWLSRAWGPAALEEPGSIKYSFILFIGMNPSTADASHNDPTITREIGFAQRWGFNKLYKFNVGDYRATHPRDLSKPGVNPVSALNLPTMSFFARKDTCAKVVLCCGQVPPVLRQPMADTIRELNLHKVKLWCFGRNGDGSPKHPLFLTGSASLEPFEDAGVWTKAGWV